MFQQIFDSGSAFHSYAEHGDRLRVLEHHGTGRIRGAEAFEGHDLVITTYGTLLRDIEWLKDVEFDCAVLDESQADSVAFVVVYGSYVTGQMSPKSDVDVVFVGKDARAFELQRTFISQGIGYDFFCMPIERVRRIVDWKCPGSGMESRNHPSILGAIRSGDELR